MDYLSHLHCKEKKKKMAGGRSWLPALKGHLPGHDDHLPSSVPSAHSVLGRSEVSVDSGSPLPLRSHSSPSSRTM